MRFIFDGLEFAFAFRYQPHAKTNKSRDRSQGGLPIGDRAEARAELQPFNVSLRHGFPQADGSRVDALGAEGTGERDSRLSSGQFRPLEHCRPGHREQFLFRCPVPRLDRHALHQGHIELSQRG